MATNTKSNTPSMVQQNRQEDDKTVEKMSSSISALIALLSLYITAVSLFQVADKSVAERFAILYTYLVFELSLL